MRVSKSAFGSTLAVAAVASVALIPTAAYAGDVDTDPVRLPSAKSVGLGDGMLPRQVLGLCSETEEHSGGAIVGCEEKLNVRNTTVNNSGFFRLLLEAEANKDAKASAEALLLTLKATAGKAPKKSKSNGITSWTVFHKKDGMYVAGTVALKDKRAAYGYATLNGGDAKGVKRFRAAAPKIRDAVRHLTVAPGHVG